MKPMETSHLKIGANTYADDVLPTAARFFALGHSPPLPS